MAARKSVVWTIVALVVWPFAAGADPGAARDSTAAFNEGSAPQERFYKAQGEHFNVLFEGPADQALARRVVERLEAAYWRVGQTLTAYPSEPVTVVLYTLEQFRDITRLPDWATAAYDGRIHLPIRGALQHAVDLDRVLAHEFVHVVVAMLAGRNAPVWLNEGLARALEPGGVEEAERILAATDVRPRLGDLHQSFARLGAAEAHVAYAISARAVQRMLESRGAPAVVTLLRDLGRGAPFASAFHQRIAVRYDDFQAMVAR